MKFTNDGPSALLIQTHTEGSDAFFTYYGTRDSRRTIILGPYTWDHRSPPPDKVEYTTELPPGVRKKVGSRVPGMKSAWYRVVQKTGTGTLVNTFQSNYQARPLYYQIGVAPKPKGPPSWLGL